MRSAAGVFYLAVFTLLGTSHASEKIATRAEASTPDVCAIEPQATVSDACASYSTLDSINNALSPALHSVTKETDFFAYYRLNLFNRVCPFWSDATSMCGNIACAVNTLDNEEDIPKIWRAEELGKLEGPKAEHPGRREQAARPEKPLRGELGEDVGESCVVEYDDECDERDYCIPEDESASAKGDYVSLVDNPERFTGYMGLGARQVWDAIYRENCFSKGGGQSNGKVGQPKQPNGRASNALRSVMKGHERQLAIGKIAEQGAVEDVLQFDDECLEKRVFYRIISGMHASISAHICWDYLNQKTGTWGPNLQCYVERLHMHPERISNLYFNYALVLRAVTKLRRHLKDYQYCSGDLAQDRMTKRKVLTLVDQASSAGGPDIFDESLMFQDSLATGLKEDFRNRFRNVSRLMDCVGCDKCRLWGKLQTAGYGAALKVLFEYDESATKNDNPLLRRTELVALVNTLDVISSSLIAVEKFRGMLENGVVEQPTEPISILGGETTSKGQSQIVKEVPAGNAHEDDDDDEEEESTRPHYPTVKEAFKEELGRIREALGFVVQGWVKFPRVVFNILVSELARVWDWWLGIPVKPRSWAITSTRRTPEDVMGA
ncbi:MAG: Cyclin-dependent kinases regulatory subunit (Cell division control protein cks1), partial [Chaenotheca gracillima]